MALDFPNAPTNGQVYTAAGGEQWIYEAVTNSWTSKGLVNTSGGLQYKGDIDITAAPPTGISSGWQYSVNPGGTANAGFGPGVTGTIAKGSMLMYTGTSWIETSHAVPDATPVVKGIDVRRWDRTGTVVSPANAGDQVHTATGKLTVGGTAAAPAVSLDPGTTGSPLVRDASGKVGVGDPAPDSTVTIKAAAATTPLRVSGPSSEFMRCDQQGRFLVGTSTAVAAGAKLQTVDGITFPAAQVASADPNTLDDYEEGTWTPTITNTGFTYTYSTQTGTYTKVGRTVTLSWRVAVTARSGSANGALPTIAIPFAASASFTSSAIYAQHPAQLVVHKASAASTSGTRTFLYSGFSNNANTYFWIASIASNGDPLDLGPDFHLGGVFTYEV